MAGVTAAGIFYFKLKFSLILCCAQKSRNPSVTPASHCDPFFFIQNVGARSAEVEVVNKLRE